MSPQEALHTFLMGQKAEILTEANTIVTKVKCTWQEAQTRAIMSKTAEFFCTELARRDRLINELVSDVRALQRRQ